ncbi:MAG: peptide chain release factor N(5)-glutamine methyltransferase [Bacteroidales bacterium]
MRTIREILAWLIQDLSRIYPTYEATNMAWWLLEDLLNEKKIELKQHLDDPFPNNSEPDLNRMHDESMQHVPLQYISGKAYFRNLILKVDENVLIPRPETEFLVENILQTYKSSQQLLYGLDIGTGSGCIPIALMSESDTIFCDASDISVDALKIAKNNALEYELKPNFIVDDIRNFNLSRYRQKPYDFIVSNPPYVPEADKVMMRKNVLDHEPSDALFVPDDNALLYYKAILKFALQKLAHDGWLFLEIHEKKGEELCQLLEDNHFTSIELLPDLTGKARFIRAQME